VEDGVTAEEGVISDLDEAAEKDTIDDIDVITD
jgi:hypothetical protein